MKKDERRNLRVLVKCYADVTSATRVQDAKIRTLENALISGSTSTESVDTTEPIVTIKALQVKAIAYTQGINGKGEWDGTLEFKDKFGADIPLMSDMSVITFGDNVTTSTQVPTKSSFSERFIPINICGQINLHSDAYSWYRLKNEFSWSDAKKKTWKTFKEGY